MARGWTGGQFALLRVALASIALAELSPPLSSIARVLGGGACLAFAAGVWTRWSASATLLGLLATGGPLMTALSLGLAAAAPAAPYGSLDARNRVDPSGGWQLPDRITVAGTVALGLALAFAGGQLVGVQDRLPLGAVMLSCAALLVPRRTRPFAWLLAGATLVSGVVPLQTIPGGVLGVWLFAFEPRWLAARSPPGTARLFYDGNCGLCHGAVRFMLAEDAQVPGSALRFSPLGGATFRATLPESRRALLPDSVVLLDGDGTLATRSVAVVRLGRRLGGIWSGLAGLLALVPRPLADAAYDALAASRRRIASTPDDACPMLPPELRARFDA